MAEEYPFPSIRRRKRRKLLIGGLLVVLLGFGVGTAVVRVLRAHGGVPTVTAASPAVGDVTGGTSVVLTGTGFTSDTAVWFGDTLAQHVEVASDTRLTAISPKAPWPALTDIVVARGAGSRSTLRDGFRYTSYIAVDSLSPARGPAAGGTIVTISGAGFAPDSRVMFGDAPALRMTYIDQRTLRVQTPQHVPGVVAVTVSAGTSATATKSAGFTYQ